MLRLAPALTLALFLAPIGAGLIGTVLPAFGIFPPLGRYEPSLEPWRDLFATPGLASTVRLTLVTGFAATLLSVLLAAGFCALSFDRPFIRRLEHALAPLIATPHVAVAIGFAFLIAPSGWIVRLISPELTGWETPPALVTLRDPSGLSFMAGLTLKEAPYLVLMMIAATGQVKARAMMATARSAGYTAPMAWAKVILPQIYGQVRLPIYAVLAFSLSVVEVGLILAPGTPPPLSVLAVRWFTSYDLALYLPAAAAAMLQFLIVVAAIGLWRAGELAVSAWGKLWIEGGRRRGLSSRLLAVAGWAAIATGLMNLAAITTLILWSLAQDWRFPDKWPDPWTLQNWARLGGIMAPFQTTILVGLGASAIAVSLTLACLENEQRRGLHPGAKALRLLYLPLLVPQIAFLFGAQVVLVGLDLDATLVAVIWSHLLFVLPYCFLSLADPYRALDPRYARIAAGLGAGPARIFFTVKAPMLLKSILVSLAIGFAVSVGLYLPTVFAGAGRIATLTTEAVTLSGGADRRLVGATALLQAGLPLVAYTLALALPVLLYRNRRGL